MADIIYDTQEAVPEDLREFAAAKDGKYAVSVAPLAKLTEFRDNNITVSRDRDNLSTLIGKLKTDIGFDPEKYDEFKTSFDDLRSTKQLVDDGKLVKDSSLDEAVQKRTTQMQRDHQAQVDTLSTNNKNLQTENDELKQRVDNMELDAMVGLAARDERSGIRSDAVQAVLREAREVFKRRENRFVPLDNDGNMIFGGDGVSPMTPLEWIKTKLAGSAPYLFKDSSGGGAGGSNGLNGQDLSGLSPSERMRIAREAGAGR